MKSEERQLIEELVRSSADPPRATVGFRKRVLRAARRAEKERAAERRVRWTLCLAGSAALLLAAIGPFLPSLIFGNSSGSLSITEGAAQPPNSTEKDWDLVDKVEKERSIKAGMLGGTD